MTRLCILALATSLAACSGKAQPAAAKAKGASAKDSGKDSGKGATAQAKKDPPPDDPIDDGPNKKDPNPEAADGQPEPAAADGAAADGAAADPAAADPLGKRFLDPPWFRKHMFADAKDVEVKRTEADAKGRFSSQILFDLADGATADTCAKTVEAKVKEHLPNLKRAPGKDDGRIQLEGASERYTATFVCGEVKGAMKAYVSYRWID